MNSNEVSSASMQGQVRQRGVLQNAKALNGYGFRIAETIHPFAFTSIVGVSFVPSLDGQNGPTEILVWMESPAGGR